jgi:hypothetical protein
MSDAPARGLIARAEDRLRVVARRGMRRGKYMLGYTPLTLPIYLRLAPRMLGISDTSKVGIGSRIDSSTNLVVEGFPRSGNTFCAETFRLVGGEGFGVVSHVHHVAQVKAAVRKSVPTIVVVRDPVACLSSYLVGGPHATVRGVLREYIAYHEGLHRIIGSCMVVDFDDLTGDIDSVIDRANRIFGFELRALADVGTTEDVFTVIDADHRSRYEGEEGMLLPRPDDERRDLNARYRVEILEPERRSLLARARRAKRMLLESGLD